MFLYGDLHLIAWVGYTDKAATVSEAIALQLRRPDSDRPYLYAQLYAGMLLTTKLKALHLILTLHAT